MAEFTFTSLEVQITRALRQASAEVQDRIGALVVVTANRARDRVRQAFPVGPTGNLREMVFTSQPRTYYTTATGQNVPVWQVRATAPHVFIWEEGTRERFDSTRGNARRGRSPRHGKVFEAIAAQERQLMLAQAQAILDRNIEI